MRNRLPDRRPSVTIDKGRFAITLGYHPETGEAARLQTEGLLGLRNRLTGKTVVHYVERVQ